MTTAMERVQARASQAQEHQQQEAERLEQDRVQAWAAIQREAPDLATFLRSVSEAFGKPEDVRATWRVE